MVRIRFAGAAAVLAPLLAQEPVPTFVPDLFAVELPCPDVAAAVAFYRDALAFAMVRDTAPAHCLLAQGSFHLLLRRSRSAPAAPDTSSLSLNIRVADLAAAVGRAVAAGGSCPRPEPQPFALGESVGVRDPAGHRVHLLTLAGDPLPVDAAPRLFNLGWHVADLERTERFWTAFGIPPFSREYLPATLPMRRLGAAALVFHAGGAAPPIPPGPDQPTLHFAVAALAPAAAGLAANGTPPTSPLPSATPLGRAVRLRDPDGLGIAVVERGPARLCYERLLATLPGAWHARSSQGWESRTRFVRMAADSVLVEDDPQEAPADAMLSCFAMDGDRLLLTHYCHAGNQPRLVADLSTATTTAITFRFLDGGNLASRDVGHMDELRLVLEDSDHVRSQWRWYQSGEQRPMEEIVYVRVQ